MVGNDLFLSDEIIYTDIDHVYKNLVGEQYTSVTRLIKSIKVPFDSRFISGQMAAKVAEDTGVTKAEAQKDILSSWDETRESSIVRGHYVHDSLERYLTDGSFDKEMEPAVKVLGNILKEYTRFYPEQLLYSHKYKVAGRCDLILQRQKSKSSPVFDIIDYKSNESKGIVFDSINRKNVAIRHNNKYFLHPLEHLEECNYTEYALQLSIYAFLVMERLGFRIGKLNIMFIDNDFIPHIIPVPFMYHEAKLLCEVNLNRKELPEIESNDPPTRIEVRTYTNEGQLLDIKEEWD